MASRPPASVSDQMDVPVSGSSAVAAVRRSAPVLLHLLRSRFGCEAQILGLDLDSAPGRRAARPPVVPEKRLETALSSGVKVSVWKADLTNFSAAAIVNAANSRLLHFGGLALALSEAGGDQVQRESDDYVKANGELKTGDAVALGPGKLKCKMIIHAVGPQLSFRPNAHEVSAAKRQLERAIRNVLEIVERKQLDTVAIPAISSGIFNFPVDECADAIVSTVRTFYGSSTSHRFKPREVFLVNNDDPTVKEMEWACVKLLVPAVRPQTSAPVSYSQAAASSGRPHTTASVSYSQAAAGGGKPYTTASGAQTRKKGGTQSLEVQLGLVRVLLRRGRLEEQKMDVIVNTAAASRDLSYGRVSRALLNKAGYKMQEEIQFAPLTGSVVITKAYSLFCKQVYHTFCAERTTVGAHQLLFRSVQECLWTAVGARHQSIALPAIGTGALGFQKHEIAQVMWNAAVDFGLKSPQPLEVHFVIFPSDDAVYKAFEDELKSVQSLASQSPHFESFSGIPGAAQGLNSKPAFNSEQEQASAGWNTEVKSSMVTEPCIRLQSPSDQSRSEAEAWLRGLLYNQFNTVCISNNFTQLLGERDLEELSLTEVEGVQVEEFLEKGRSGLVVSGERAEDIAVAALKLEEMLQTVQRQFLKEEEEELRRTAQSSVKVERSPVSSSDPQLRPFTKDLRRLGLQIVTVERVENPALEKVFKLQKAQMPSRSSEDLLQLVPAQFCDLVSRVGFRPECAPPDDSSLGEGLYFAADVLTALSLWTDRSDQFLYLFVAEVLKGKPGPGRPGLVLAPGLDSGSEPGTRCDCVDQSGVTVVFNHRQSLPRFILICSRDHNASSV